MAGVNIKAEGDLAALDIRSRITLAMLFDPPKDGHDWRYHHHHVCIWCLLICENDNQSVVDGA